MIGRMTELALHLPLWAGFFFVLCAVGIVLRRDSRKYLKDSELLKIVAELKEQITKIEGMARIAGLAGVCAFVMLMVGAAVFYHKIEEYPVVEMHNVEVEQAIGDLSYWFIDEHGARIYATFCDTLGYPPPFDRGETILTLKFKNRGTCWDMHDVHPKYVMLRDEEGNLVIKEN